MNVTNERIAALAEMLRRKFIYQHEMDEAGKVLEELAKRPCYVIVWYEYENWALDEDMTTFEPKKRTLEEARAYVAKLTGPWKIIQIVEVSNDSPPKP